MAKAKLAWASSADMVWAGNLRDDFREVAGGIVRQPLSDDAWAGLCRVVRLYANELSYEHEAVGLSQQVDAANAASKACAAFIEALELIDTPPYGQLLTGLVSEKWEESRGHKHEARQNDGAMARDIDALDAVGAVEREDNPDVPFIGERVVREWRNAGRLSPPIDGRGLLVLLWEVQEALKMSAAELNSGKLKRVQGESFTGLVGLLDKWQQSHGFGLGAYKYDTHGNGNFGRLTDLVKAIIEEIPILYDENGDQLPKQIRPHKRTDGALGEAVAKARAAYQSY